MASSSNPETNSDGDALEGIDKSDPRYRNIILIEEYRDIKKQLREKQAQRHRDDMMQKLTKEQELLQTSDVDVIPKIVEITDKVPEAIQNIKEICGLSKSNVQSDIPETLSSSSTNCIFVETPMRCLKKLKKGSPSPSVSTPKKSFSPTLDCERIKDFKEMIISLAKLFNISNKDEFDKNYSQLLDALDVFKDYKISTDTFSDMERKYEELIAEKNEIDNMFEAYLSQSLGQLEIGNQNKSDE